MERQDVGLFEQAHGAEDGRGEQRIRLDHALPAHAGHMPADQVVDEGL
jgi:hypothetical protein